MLASLSLHEGFHHIYFQNQIDPEMVVKTLQLEEEAMRIISVQTFTYLINIVHSYRFCEGSG